VDEDVPRDPAVAAAAAERHGRRSGRRSGAARYGNARSTGAAGAADRLRQYGVAAVSEGRDAAGRRDADIAGLAAVASVAPQGDIDGAAAAASRQPDADRLAAGAAVAADRLGRETAAVRTLGEDGAVMGDDDVLRDSAGAPG